MEIVVLLAVAAGSGGHILPAITLAYEWKQEQANRRVVFITGNSALEHRIMKQPTAVDHALHLPLAKISLRRWYRLPLFCIQLAHLFLKSLFALWEHKPQRIISTGGIHAIPVCFAAWIMRIPIDVYELNVLPGKAVQILKYFATRLFCVFKETQSYLPKSTLISYPIRHEIKQAHIPLTDLLASINQQHREQPLWLPFEIQRKTIFILGGSQGSQLLNKLIKAFLAEHETFRQRIQVIHQTGAFEEMDWQHFYKHQQIPALTFSYDPLITRYYQCADLIICRAGAGTLFEIAYLQRPCIVIPLLAHTTDHQLYNARAMAEYHPTLFTVITQKEVAIHPEVLFKKIKSILAF
ncbi:UDP-N-acetylglucosamine--N-acetylmuramyl-(pentapeptide) pyrophosphoryl-undecaprenol N-acetylglucosamine transferase [Candidatus Dependentiae bacterium]|nr:UDP-N-acetylglucosamine--N-acetylmuramyl-(pentapeptide) pyrophosphoryl-undecaprenol N-acetylglucosamine transferase [Candidatus Dependentiae bacterium]